MMNKTLEGKRVLFLGYVYFDYHIKITNALIKEGAKVDYFPVMNYNFKYTILRRLSKKMFLNHNRKHGEGILEQTKNKTYDYVFVIQGHTFPPDFFIKLREQNPKAVFLNYHWDAVRITEFGNSLLDVIPFFDKAYSFDRADCEKHKKLYYLPLFYTDRNVVKREIKYDIAFVGSVTTYRRYNHVKKVEKYCNENGLTFKYFLLIPFRDYVKFALKGKVMKGVSFKTIPYSQVQEMYAESRVVIDLPNQIQTGLTMRIIEVLADGMKLVTSNPAIKKENFFNEDNIQVLDLDAIHIDKDFIRKDIPSVDMTGYHIQQWVRDLFLG
ncbi:hypothetical protein N9Y10_00825 [Flavobacteriaceae bacterium]|nr:hypothetical protein [Flavobacteriaceae bacterium]